MSAGTNCNILKPEDALLQSAMKNMPDEIDCLKCGGTGLNKKGNPCKKCKGTGKLSAKYFGEEFK